MLLVQGGKKGHRAFCLSIAGAAEDAGQAAGLCKADLATSMVMEMTALAGIMGCHSALTQGVKPQVAEVHSHPPPL
jgi:glycyl-tRNA synthetase beta subunit